MDTIAVFDDDNDYECHVYQPEFQSVESTDQEAIFLFYIFSETPPIVRHKMLIMQRQQLLRGGDVYCSTMLSRNLTALNVPHRAHPSIIQKITDSARAAANEDHNMNCKIIHLVANIRAEINNEEEAVVATRSIKALKEIRIKGCSSKKTCVICLEEMEAGSKAAGLPCLHMYHQDCIVGWLKISNLCPLCRFPMPL